MRSCKQALGYFCTYLCGLLHVPCSKSEVFVENKAVWKVLYEFLCEEVILIVLFFFPLELPTLGQEVRLQTGHGCTIESALHMQFIHCCG